MRECGMTVQELAAEFERSEGAIKYTIQTYAKTGTTQERPRSGRPPILSLHQKKIIYRKACAAPKIEYSELAIVGVFVRPDGTTSKPPSYAHYTGRLRELASLITAPKRDQSLTADTQ
jgi:hypothetical protein